MKLGETLARICSRLDEPRIAWLVLGGAMALGGALMLIQGRDTTFSGDELAYYARLIEDDGTITAYDGPSLNYLFAPHNGHLAFFGKLVYEAVFAVGSPGHAALRVIETLAVLACVGLFFEFARRRVGSALALAPCFVLLALGAAWENLLWPFDLHTALALAAGLGAMLALERADRRGNAIACALLVLAAFTIELGLVFVLAAAVVILFGPERRRRWWVFALPAALYAVWWAWALRFGGESELALANLPELPGSLMDSLTAVIASLLGLFPAGPTMSVHTLGTTTWGAALAVALLVALAVRLARGPVSPWTWAFAVAVLGYWALIGLADRPEDSARYLFAGSVLLLCLLADAWRGARVPSTAVLVAFALAAVAIPQNLTKLSDGRRFLVNSATASGIEYAMLELAGENGQPFYVPFSDPELAPILPQPELGLNAATYLNAAEAQGSIAFSLDEIRDGTDPVRQLADATLARSLGLELAPASEPADTAGCVPARDGEPVDVPAGGTLVGAPGEGSEEVALGRFRGAASFSVGPIDARSWAKLAIPGDAAPEPWRLYSEAPVLVCPL